MRSITRRVLGLATAALLGVTGLVAVGPAAPAQAAGCRVSPYSASPHMWDAFSSESGVQYQDFGPYYTTSQCSDINMKNTGRSSDGLGVFSACVVFVNHTNSCNYWTYMPYGEWKNIATNVKDGTKFKIRVQLNFDRYWGMDAVADF